ncbi:MAG: tRNA 2-thiouridine(34) synthase MnmA, partial [Myxococcota bacterium]|nr:tRNA 2-thiouridine(34) synthase MnmA [Myxococcota bacterium]
MRVVAAMSGGVDSSVTAALLLEQGYDVIGVHMKLHDADPLGAGEDKPKSCCGLDDVLDCRRVADRLNIPFYVMDLRREFQKAVMDDFADNYVRGLTPNPCIQCNGVLKFRILLRRA